MGFINQLKNWGAPSCRYYIYIYMDDQLWNLLCIYIYIWFINYGYITMVNYGKHIRFYLV